MSDAPNPQSLTSAREQRKLDLLEVAEYTGISASRLEEFEAGERKPSLRQVEQLAALYNVPIYLLFLDAIPNLELLLPDFRKTDPRPADISPRGLTKIWAVEKISLFTRQLEAELTHVLPAKRTLPRANRLSASFANRLRAEFDEWFASRRTNLALAGPSSTQTLTGLRLFFETCGSLSLVNDAPESDYMGFYSEPQGGLRSIFINRKISSKKAQLFTFAHEFAHSLIGEEGISDPFKTSNEIERRCNKFAAEFLAPSDQFSKLVSQFYARDKGDVFSLIRKVSENSLLSNQATAIRLLEHDYIKRTDYNAFAKAWRSYPSKEKEEEKLETPPGRAGAFAKRVGELGYYATYVSALAIKQNIVDSIDVQRGLALSESIQEKAFSLAQRRFEAAVK